MKRKNERSLPPLSRLELEVMQAVWSLGECSTGEVIAEFNRGRERQLADTTIRTVVGKIREKGYVELVPSTERGHRLRPAVRRGEVARRSLFEVVGSLFAGSPREAILQLLGDDALDDDDLEAIRRRIDAAERGGGS